ncbi:MAG TPA: response regulator [Candidatus Methylomirabilis sp.]|nr:response regulator [Candidatus Methylomirabilis sp.]
MSDTILLVDDDRLILEICKDVLEQAGYRTVCLQDGRTVTSAVAANRPALIILDIMMPGTDGLGLCKQLRSGPEAFRGPIVIVSAKRYETDKRTAREVGANTFLEKPIRPERLLDTVQSLLTRRIAVRFWGVRGSIPTPSREAVGYGGNTPCIEVRVSGVDDIFIWDGGTGLRELGRSLRGAEAPIHGYILFTHFHWDHIQGLPFFEPAYAKGNSFTLVGPAQPTAGLVQTLGGQMASVYFPVGLEQFGAHLSFQEIDEGMATLGGVQFDTLSSLHPGRALLYRLNHDGRRVVYATDNELPLGWKAGGKSAPHEVERFIRFFADADLLIHDSQYTREEAESRVGWGHSAWTDVLDLAIAAGVKHLILFHHDPDHSDTFLDAIGAAVQERIAESGSGIACELAREGALINIWANS